MRPVGFMIRVPPGDLAMMPLVCLALAGAALACEAGDSVDLPHQGAPSGTERSQPGTREVPAVPPSQANRPADPRGLRAALETAVAAAAQAETGANDCERAYNGLAAMAGELRDRMGESGPRGAAPDRAGFMTACGRMPAETQRCMVLSYSMSHVEECRRAREALPEDMRDQLSRAARGEGPR